MPKLTLKNSFVPSITKITIEEIHGEWFYGPTYAKAIKAAKKKYAKHIKKNTTFLIN